MTRIPVHHLLLGISFFCLAILLRYEGSARSHPRGSGKEDQKAASVLDFTMNTIDGKPKPLAGYKGKVFLIVNTASECGYTPQYETLQKLYEKYKEKGFTILAFPANNFGAQEPGTNAEIKTFCTKQYHTTFDLFEKISVKGKDQHPLYHYITTQSGFDGDIKWNFQKYLVDKNGKIVKRYLSAVDPMSEEVTKDVEGLLAK